MASRQNDRGRFVTGPVSEWPDGFVPPSDVRCLGWDVTPDSAKSRLVLHVLVETLSSVPRVCPLCASRTRLVAYGRYNTMAWDLPTNGLPTRIVVRRRRYRCRSCLKHPSELLEWLCAGHDLTLRLYRAICVEAGGSTRALSRELMLAEGTIRAVRSSARREATAARGMA